MILRIVPCDPGYGRHALIWLGVRLPALLGALLLLAGCGSSGDTTTIINQTTAAPEQGATGAETPADDAAETTASTESDGPIPPGDFLDHPEHCGTLPGGFEGQPLHLWAQGIDCEVAHDLAEQGGRGRLPYVWTCAASALACENDDTGSKFMVASLVGPGEQNCPEGLDAVGDDACGLPEPEKCTKTGEVVQQATDTQAAVFSVKAINVECKTALPFAIEFGKCAPNCDQPFYGYQCNDDPELLSCKASEHKIVRFHLAYADI